MAAPENKRTLIVGSGAGAAAMLLIGLLTWFRLLVMVDTAVYDWLLIHDSRRPDDGTVGIVLVTIDEESMGNVRLQWPWPRTLHGQLIRQLQADGAKAIGIDILFLDPSTPAADADLADALRGMPDGVVLAAKLEPIERNLQAEGNAFSGRRLVLPDPLFRPVTHWGIVNFELDNGAVVRTFQPTYRHQDQDYPSFATAVFEATFRRRPDLPEDARPYIDYIGRPGTFPMVPAYQVLNGMADPTLFRNKIVLIGSTLSEAQDFHSTPFAKGNARSSGIEVHANVLSTMVRGSSIIEAWRWPQVVLAVALAAMTGYFVMFRSALALASASLISMIGVLWLTVWMLNERGVYMDPTYPLLGIVLSLAIVGMAVRQPLVLHTKIGPYMLYEELGRGGMAVVYRARHPRTGQVVALKRMLAQYASDGESLQRFLREIELIRQLDHPNIISIVDHGDVDGQPYYAMEYIEGHTLEDVLKVEKRLNPSDVRRFGGAIARALTQAHALGVIHRDIKPSNIMLTKSGMPKLTDFGIARQVNAPNLTQTGQLVGTPYYMAPELLKGFTATPRSDIYSLGATLYHLLAGRPIFESEDVSVVLTLTLFEEVPDIRGFAPEIDEALARIVMSCLGKDPADRPSSMADVAKNLDPYYTGVITLPAVSVGGVGEAHDRAVVSPSRLGGPLDTAIASAPPKDQLGRIEIRRKPPTLVPESLPNTDASAREDEGNAKRQEAGEAE